MNPEQVQGTNDSSIVSKLSMVERGYFEDPFIKYFVEKPSRRSPLINRCYFARAVAISYSVEKFLEDLATPKQIVSLGAGFDTTYFRLKQKNLTDDLSYIEVDFPDVMRRKIALAKRGNLLLNEDTNNSGAGKMSSAVIYRSDGYTAVGYDLQTVGKEFQTLLSSIGVDFEAPTLFLSEVVLTYLPSKKSSRVLQWIAKDFSNAVVTVFEQVSPDDSFGFVMCKHFKQIGSPLLAISDYPTIAKHVERHSYFGFDCSSAISLDRFYYHFVKQEKQKFVHNLEIFDEFEAWNKACQHYFILCSTNSKDERLRSFASSIFQANAPCIGTKSTTYPSGKMPCVKKKNELVQRYGHCSSLISLEDREYVAIIGGFGISNGKSAHQRLNNNVCLMDISSSIIMHHCEPDDDSKNFLRFPMFGTAVTTHCFGQSAVLLFGGRASPTKPTDYVFMLTFKRSVTVESNWLYKVEILQSLCHEPWPAPRWRHCADVFRNGRGECVILSGGRNMEQVFGDCWRYDIGNQTWAAVSVSGEEISPRHSHSTCTLNSNTVLISGGLGENAVPFDDLFQMEFQAPEFIEATVTRVLLANSPPPIYSHSSHCLGTTLFIVGGVTSYITSQYGDEGLVDVIRLVDLKTGEWRNCGLTDDTALPIMLHNHSSVISRVNNELIVSGGGDNCFSFGTWFNRSPFAITLQSIMSILE